MGLTRLVTRGVGVASDVFAVVVVCVAVAVSVLLGRGSGVAVALVGVVAEPPVENGRDYYIAGEHHQVNPTSPVSIEMVYVEHGGGCCVMIHPQQALAC